MDWQINGGVTLFFSIIDPISDWEKGACLKIKCLVLLIMILLGVQKQYIWVKY